MPYLTGTESPLFSIKIPRKIERRIAHPGMNLYDYLVTLNQDDCTILQRVGSDVRSQTFFYGDIQYLRHESHLLRGSLQIATPGTLFDLPFSTVSDQTMVRIVDLIRRRYTNGAGQVPDVAEPMLGADDLSYYFNGLLEKQKTNYPEQRILAAQTEKSVGSYETNPLRRLFFGVISKSLLESLHFSDGREIKIISRGKPYKYRGQSIYGKETCIMPLSSIRRACLAARPPERPDNQFNLAHHRRRCLLCPPAR